MTRIVDLSMPVHPGMQVFPRVQKPVMLMYEDWKQFAKGVGADKHGCDWLTAHYLVIIGDHVGTHVDALKHLRGPDAPGPEGIPLDHCYGDGVVLDFRHKEKGSAISAADIDKALHDIGYQVKPRDIVLIHTGAGAYHDEDRYLTDHCGMSEEATRLLISRGVRMMGIDAPTFDPPVWAMFERKEFWRAHLVMMDSDYWHIENLANLDQLPPTGFTLSVLPVLWVGTTGAPMRAVALIDD